MLDVARNLGTLGDKFSVLYIIEYCGSVRSDYVKSWQKPLHGFSTQKARSQNRDTARHPSCVWGSGLYESHLDIWKFLNTAGPYRVMGSVLGFSRDSSETYSYYHTLLTRQLSSTGNACFFRHSATSEALVAAVPNGSM